MITYTIPARWANFEDLPGNFLLVPPGGTLDGVAASTSDYLGIYARVAADGPECQATRAPGIALSASAITNVLSTRPGVTSTIPKPVVVGGLRGFVLDIRLRKGWTRPACPVPEPNVPLLVGLAPSSFEDAIVGMLVIRLFLLDHGNDVLAIEVDDVSGGSHLFTFDPVVASLRFGPG